VMSGKLVRYWESIPVFRHRRQALILAQLLTDYFMIQKPTICQTDRGWWKLGNLPEVDNHKTLAIEAFIVGWGRGYEDGCTMTIVRDSRRQARDTP